MSVAQLMAQHEVLVFDLDGTLVDSGPDIRGTLDLALRDCGIAGVTDDDWVNLHSPLADIVRDALVRREAPVERKDAVIATYRQRLAQSRYEKSNPYAGVKDFLADCQRRGHRLAVCTNKAHGEALKMLAHFGLHEFFSEVVGAECARLPKPDAAPLELLLERLEAFPAQAVLVGDTHVDAQCARNAGVDFVWHRPGYGDPALTAALASAVFDSWEELSSGGCEVM